MKLRLRQRAGLMRRIQIVPYRGFGNPQQIHFRGRVLRLSGTRSPIETDRPWRNLLAAYRRFHTVELPGATVRVQCGSESQITTTDAEGYFEFHLDNTEPHHPEPWREARFALENVTSSSGELVTATGRALIPPPNAKFGVISDIDDTVLVTHATHPLRMATLLLLRNARSRMPFEGVAAFYTALQQGASPGDWNPIFYLSSGPWNLYDLITDFFSLNQIPDGPVFLQDYGIDQGKFLAPTHAEHKLAHIRLLLQTYPDLPFVLIGDSGQHDPEIYGRVLKEVPARIKAIYIRNVSNPARVHEIELLAKQTREHGGELLLVQDSLAAARHAGRVGLIQPSALDLVEQQTAADHAHTVGPGSLS